MPSLSWPALAAASMLAFGNVVEGVTAVFPEQTRGIVEDIFGRSPIPTHPPRVPRGIPKELVQREDILPYPPQPYICGLVNNNIYDPLTCNNHLATCAQFGNDIGCCMTNLEDCTAIPTTCVQYTETCGPDCYNDPETLFCYDSYMPYCATYFFESTAEFYGCYTTSGHTLQVTYLSDYYSSALGPDYTTYGDIGITNKPSSTSVASSGTSAAAGQTSEPIDESGGGGGGLSGGAIAGIVVGVLAIVAFFVAFMVWVFVIKRKNNQNDPPAPTQPVQQIPPSGGAPPVAGPQQPVYDQPPPPMPYNQHNQNGSGYFTPENKIGPTSPTDPPQYNQPYSPVIPAQGSSDASGLQAYNPGAPQQPQPPLGQHAGTPTDYQNHSQNNSIHIPPGGSGANEMDGSNGIHSSSAAPPTNPGYELSANNAGPEPVYELSNTR
ncbi:hypothetical protein FQN54_005211 [Arachnomyces sp. PD_36]|nr:hypothetical protein FQN54_005211 [Arachnomyces sp. PD_36]